MSKPNNETCSHPEHETAELSWSPLARQGRIWCRRCGCDFPDPNWEVDDSAPHVRGQVVTHIGDISGYERFV